MVIIGELTIYNCKQRYVLCKFSLKIASLIPEQAPEEQVLLVTTPINIR